ncbi:larval cuticle protein LCP-17-like isoform X2 [Colias croceus]|uniref:larval cuticle protein LCP-17-like isoform X1 n=1 Tax=Colias crocea TaxID=72248 RepID=UPI001E27E892|nr:larval cuticle protein LCP-17-like isoform X1 [Colias croceus]XP_045498194.1 larval cuticle protein LCP-17-like isoform X2 [Colias croceus]
MKFIIVLAVFVACASADVSHVATADYIVPIVRSSNEQKPDGGFNYAFETGNGIITQADGVVKNPNTEDATLQVTGSVKYVAPDGTPVELSYVADQDGYKPVGSHVPQIPELILRAQQYIASHPPVVKKL